MLITMVRTAGPPFDILRTYFSYHLYYFDYFPSVTFYFIEIIIY